MQSLLNSLKTNVLESPRWVQLELQGFWYGLLSWSLTCTEDTIVPIATDITVLELLHHADEEFESWPTDWLEPSIAQFLDLGLTYDQQQEFFTALEQVFQDSVPTDINIFSVLANGDSLIESQWERIHAALAFRNPPEPPKKQPTRRIHGRRALTPIKRRKAFTRHRVMVVKG
jgi:hypothetical protein